MPRVSPIHWFACVIYYSVASKANDKKYVALSAADAKLVETKTSRSSMRSIANLVSKLGKEAQAHLEDSEMQVSIMELNIVFTSLKIQYEKQVAQRSLRATLIQKVFYAIFSFPTKYACHSAITTLRQTRNLWLHYFSRPIDVNKPETHGSRGLMQVLGAAIAHESYGDEDDKRDKDGRNCDQVGIGFNVSGRPCAIVADGSGVRKSALVVASGAVDGSLGMLSRKEYFTTNPSENREACIRLLLNTLDPKQNPFWAPEKVGDIKDANAENGGGSTTASIVSTIAEGNKLYISGAVLGDAVALHINCRGRVSILACEVGDPEKGVSNAKGQLRAPSLGSAGGIGKNAQITPFAREVEKGDLVLLASDFLSDNVANATAEEFQQTISYIIQHSIFDYYDALKEQLHSLNPDPELLFSQDEIARQRGLEMLKKPTERDFTDVLGEQPVSASLTSRMIVHRLNNYSKWINEHMTLPVRARMKMTTTPEYISQMYPYLMTIEPKLNLERLKFDNNYIPRYWKKDVEKETDKVPLTPEQKKSYDLFIQDYEIGDNLSKMAEKGVFGKSDDATIAVFDPFMKK